MAVQAPCNHTEDAFIHPLSLIYHSRTLSVFDMPDSIRPDRIRADSIKSDCIRSDKNLILCSV